METIILKVFDDPIEANLLAARLESNGIDCFLENENIVAMDRLLSNAVGGIRLIILKSDLERTLEVLKVGQIGQAANDELLKCPSCGSTDLLLGQKSMRGVKGLIGFIVSLFTFSYPLYYKVHKICNSCGERFE